MKKINNKKCKFHCSEERVKGKLVMRVQKWNNSALLSDADKVVCPYTGYRCRNILKVRKLENIIFKKD